MKLKLWFIFVLLLLMFSGALPVNGNGTSEKKNLDKLINKTKDQIRQEKRKERSTLGNLLKQQKELGQLEKNYYNVKTQLNQTQNKLYSAKMELTHLQRNLRQLNLSLDEQRMILGSRLNAIYKYGPQSILETLFNAEDFADFVSRFGTIAYFVRKDLDTIAKFKSTTHQITKQQREVKIKKDQVEDEYLEISKLQQKVYAEQKKVESKVKLTQSELAKIQNNRVSLEKALEEYEQTSREIENQIRRSQDGSTKLLGTGQLSWPARGRISSGFGWRTHPVLKTRKYHSGIDIALPIGTSIVAADNGVVLVSGWKGGYGYFLAIDHGRGVSTCYGHNSRLLVKVGEKVFKGQRVALSGNTGLSTGPHVHFEVRLNGAPANPYQYLP